MTTLNDEKSTKNDEKLTKTGGEASDDDDFEVLDPEEDLPDEICDQGSLFKKIIHALHFCINNFSKKIIW